MCKTLKTVSGLCMSRQQRRQALPLVVVLFMLVGFYVFTNKDSHVSDIEAGGGTHAYAHTLLLSNAASCGQGRSARCAAKLERCVIKRGYHATWCAGGLASTVQRACAANSSQMWRFVYACGLVRHHSCALSLSLSLSPALSLSLSVASTPSVRATLAACTFL